MSIARLDLDLSDPGPIPEAAIEAATELMKTGRLHRYGEFSGTEPHVANLEAEYAAHVGAKYAIAVNSGGCGIFLALKAIGIKPGDKVLVNAFNLAPVPGAIAHAGADSVLVDINDDFLIDFEDLERKAISSGARVLLLTHMRGHIADMMALVDLCEQRGIQLIEDCAHTMEAKWNGRYTGTFGAVGCFSCQTFKHINSGEGGLIVCDDEDIAAQLILYSGCYMLYDQHKSKPGAAVMEKWAPLIPNFSMRMSNLSACLLRPQLQILSTRKDEWNSRYFILESRLNDIPGIYVPPRKDIEDFVASSIQFHVVPITAYPNETVPTSAQFEDFTSRCASRGVAIKWFGRDTPIGYTSQYYHWGYLNTAPPSFGIVHQDDSAQILPKTSSILRSTFDMRIPLSLTDDHCKIIEAIIREEVHAVFS